MTYDPTRHHRRSVRLRGYDYSAPSAYFITICAQNRQCLFGTVEGGEMLLSDAGRMIERWWNKLHRKFLTVRTDVFMVMPDHMHGIIVIVAPNGNGARGDGDKEGGYINPPLRDDDMDADARGVDDAESRDISLSTVVQWFKIMTTTEYIRHVKESGWPPFDKRIWQRNYYERIIRSEHELDAVRHYIADNPVRLATYLDVLLARMDMKE